jgi:hypothetical protein
MKLRILAGLITTLVVGSPVAMQGFGIPGTARKAARQTKPSKPLPEVLASVLLQVRAKSRMSVLLPTELPQPFGRAKHAVIERAGPGEYAISLYYQMNVGDAGFAALFAANANPKDSPAELGNVRVVKLARGLRGYFRPVSGSRAPANLWWEESGALYQIQLKLRSSLREGDQEKTMTAVADSAILAGPR